MTKQVNRNDEGRVVASALAGSVAGAASTAAVAAAEVARSLGNSWVAAFANSASQAPSLTSAHPPR